MFVLLSVYSLGFGSERRLLTELGSELLYLYSLVFGSVMLLWMELVLVFVLMMEFETRL